MSIKTASLTERFREIGNALPLTTEAFDGFNREIQAAILKAGPAEALALAQIKLEANKRIYQHNRGKR